MKNLLLFFISFSLIACTNTGGNKPDMASYAQAKNNFSQYQGKSVNWTGRILSTRNLAQKTVVELMAVKSRYSNADTNDLGRFVAEFPNFKDPNQYAKDRMVTIKGTLTKQQNKKIDAYHYTYPVVAVSSDTLWQKYDHDHPRWSWGVGWRSGGRGSVGIGWGW